MHTLTLDHITDQVVFIYLDIRCWSGRKTLQPDDLGLSRAQLPPDELVSLGDKRLLDPNALNVFTSLRSAARRACLEVGIRFLGGFLVPLTHSAELLAQLTQLEQRFNTARDAFLQHFDALVEEWITAHPRWEPLIRSALVPADHVAARLRFAAQVMQLKTPIATAGAHPGLAQAVGGLAETLFREVSEEDRILLTLKEVQGLSLKELGQVYGVNENALKVRLFRARKRALRAYDKLKKRKAL